MKNFDWRTIDAKLLEAIVVICKHRSVSRAADELGISQSALSHTIDKLRKLTGDELFVRVGRGVEPTSEALRIEAHAKVLIELFKSLTAPAVFEPKDFNGTFTMGVTDHEQQVILPTLLKTIRALAPRACFHLKTLSARPISMALSQELDLLFFPELRDDAEIHAKKLFDDQWMTFYDASIRRAPRSLQSFLNAHHAVVVFGQNPDTEIDKQLRRKKKTREIVLQVPSFAMLPGLLKGTDIIVSLPSTFKNQLMSEFGCIPCPIKLPPIHHYMLWHSRLHSDPSQQWLRSVVMQAVRLL